MTFNLWIGCQGGRQPLERTAEVIRAARADIVGLQETAGLEVRGAQPDNAINLAALLGWEHLNQLNGTAIITRFRIAEATVGRWGTRVELPSGRQAYVFNAHLQHAPYQPYQLLRIRYHGAPLIETEEEAIRFARAARGAQVRSLLRDIRPILRRGLPLFLTADLNEPSYLDWNAAAAAAGKCPLPVEWPSTKSIAQAGLCDAFRAVRPDGVNDRGETWTPTTPSEDSKERHDRIDFVFAGGEGVKILSAEVVGEDERKADVVVRPYPSDHRAVVAAVELSCDPRRHAPASHGSA